MIAFNQYRSLNIIMNELIQFHLQEITSCPTLVYERGGGVMCKDCLSNQEEKFQFLITPDQ